ncbi:MAG: retron St85 family effector protein [Spirochaetales bacterium]|nr:retron St85 family effector protein [Spirochaetales bacterium]
MKNIINNSNSTINKKLIIFKKLLESGFTFNPTDNTQFIFICGANGKNGKVSKRRHNVINFIEKNISDTKCIVAEKVFDIFRVENNKDNILEIENEISIFTDYIIIILESPSAFTELGAFCTKELREKLIIINNSEFDSAPSFINLGPLKALKDEIKSNRVITYKMNKDGIENTDAIGSIYNNIFEILNEEKVHKFNIFLKKDNFDPSKKTSKEALKFVHDVIKITEPVTRSELIEIMKILFGKNNYNKITHYLALLVAFDAIKQNGNYYISNRKNMYLKYLEKTDSLSISFKNSYLKYNKERLYELQRKDYKRFIHQ